jgi:hypothetical protein
MWKNKWNIKFEAENKVRIFTFNSGNFSIPEKLYKEMWKNVQKTGSNKRKGEIR